MRNNGFDRQYVTVNHKLRRATMEMQLEMEPCEELEIIDTGIEEEDIFGPDVICCWGAYAPFRM
jgi:hypothetical protein